ncbi:ATP-binding protein [Cohaesibacter celericrescens]|nr:ATP-binding protein [Cohaesibacter celericrescens]
MIWKKHSLATKLFAAFLVTSILIILVIAGLIGQKMRSGFSDYLLQVELQGMDELVDQIAKAHSDPVVWERLNSAANVWDDLVRSGMKARGAQQNPPILSLSRPPRPGIGQMPPRFEAPDRMSPPRPPAQPDPLHLGMRLSLLTPDGAYLAGARLGGRAYASRPVYAETKDGVEGKVIGWLALSSPQDGRAARDDQFLLDQFRTLLWVSLLAVGISALAAFLLARNVVTPIRALVRGTRDLAAGNYSARMKGEGPDEIGSLVRDFNSMAESLQTAEKAERQWMSDASHELKTPLAILKGRIEGLQDGIYQADAGLLSEMHQTVDRLNRLVNDLNMLTHAREGRILCDLSEENLSALVCDAVQHIGGRYAEKGLTVELDLPDGLLVYCDRNRIRQMLDNLLENARRYTDAPGKVRVFSHSVDKSADQITLVIEDSSPRPDEQDIGHLFERFYRTDPSRARQSGGSGLGLAICRAIVEAHGGSIQARPSSLGGLAVEIHLPIGMDLG